MGISTELLQSKRYFHRFSGFSHRTNRYLSDFFRAARREDISATVCGRSDVAHGVPSTEAHGPVSAALCPDQMLPNVSQCNNREEQETEASASLLTHSVPPPYKCLVIGLLYSMLLGQGREIMTCSGD